MLKALAMVFARLDALATRELAITVMVLAPVTVLVRLLSSTKMDRTVAKPRSRWADVRAVLLLSTLLAGVHALDQLRHGWFSLPCITGSWLMSLGGLGGVAGAMAIARGHRCAGHLAAAAGGVAGVLGGVAVAFALTGAQLATGFDLIFDASHKTIPWVGIAIEGGMSGVIVSGLWGLAIAYPQALDEARKRATEAETALRDAELARLRGCLEPHFLLNALNAVAGLVDEEPREARRLLACLGDLYRDALSRSDEVQPLAVEVTWLRRYAQILEARHAGALAFRWEIARDAERLAVPTLLLQPLVENAVKHGALAVEGAGEVVVRARVDADKTLTCEVEDDGPGPGAGPTRDGAQGLSIVRQRLAVRYGDRASFRLESAAGRTRAVVRIPAMVAS